MLVEIFHFKCVEVLFIYNNIKYPEKAKDDGTEGMAVVKFVVDTKGSIKDASIARSVSKECDAEVLRIMQLMNDQGILWTPGKQKGKTVKLKNKKFSHFFLVRTLTLN